MLRFVLALSLLVAITHPTAAPAAPPPGTGHLLIYGGTIYIFEGDTPVVVEALRIHDGEVVVAGTLEEARDWVAPPPEGEGVGVTLAYEHLDLEGAVAVPGLVDAHAHLFNLGKVAARVALFDTRSARECVDRGLAHADALEAEEWLFGRGWDQNDWEDARFPTREILDEAFGERPVAFERIDGHATWVNSAGLRAAGITHDTPDPEGGEILRDPATGEATGILIDEAESLFWDVVPDPSEAEMDRRLRAASERAVAQGLTGIHEMGSGVAAIQALRRAAASGELKLRMVVYLGGDEVLGEWPADPDRPGPEALVRIEGVKLYMDGALGSRGAALLADYSDRPGHRGLLMESVEEMSHKVARAFARDYAVAIHAIGDAGNRAAIDAIVAGYGIARDESTRLPELIELRPRVEHCQILDPQDIPRFAREGIIPSMQPTHCTSDMPWAPKRLGEERLVGAYAWRSLRDTGCEIPLGSDFPVEKVSPLLGLYAARTRRGVDGEPQPDWAPEQALGPVEALLGFTAWTARAVGVAEWGNLREGSRADITILDLDPLTEAPERLLEARVLRTVVEGRVVFTAE